MESSEDYLPDYVIPGWTNGPDGLVLYVRIRNTRLNIHVESEDFYDSPKAFENLLTKLDSGDDTDDLWDYLDWIVSHFLPEFREMAPPVHHVGKLTLDDLQRQHYFQCRLEFRNELPTPGHIERRQREEPHDDWEDMNMIAASESTFPRFKLSDVVVPYSDPTTVFDIVPGDVSVNGQRLFWKPAWMSAEPSIEKYSKIEASNLPSDQLRTSQLFGIVIDNRGALCGQLYRWIEISKHLTWDVLEKETEATKNKWAAQIQTTVSNLHGLNITWGDVKAGNVIIDENDNAVVIDLEGGVSKGWVDRENKGSKKGDLQGMERLMDYIMNENCPLRVRDKEMELDADEVQDTM